MTTGSETSRPSRQALALPLPPVTGQGGRPVATSPITPHRSGRAPRRPAPQDMP